MPVVTAWTALGKPGRPSESTRPAPAGAGHPERWPSGPVLLAAYCGALLVPLAAAFGEGAIGTGYD